MRKKEDKNLLVVKENNLNEAKFNISSYGYKIVLYGISKTTKDDTTTKLIRINAKEFMELINSKSKRIYEYLNEATNELIKSFLTIRDGSKIIKFNWFESITYYENEGYLEFKFHERLKPYLLYWKDEIKPYSKYLLKNILKLNSKYSIRIYELLNQYRNLHKREFELEDFKSMVGIFDSYPNYGSIKINVILKAQKELKNKTDIKFSFSEIKKNRKVVKIIFNIFENKKDDNPSNMLKNELVELLFERFDYHYRHLEIYNLKMKNEIEQILLKQHRIVLLQLLDMYKTSKINFTIVYPIGIIKSQIEEIKFVHLDVNAIMKMEDF